MRAVSPSVANSESASKQAVLTVFESMARVSLRRTDEQLSWGTNATTRLLARNGDLLSVGWMWREIALDDNDGWWRIGCDDGRDNG